MSRQIRKLEPAERSTAASGAPARPLLAIGTLPYRCAACEQQWPYSAVRHTGRCPACGGGLLRAGNATEG